MQAYGVLQHSLFGVLAYSQRPQLCPAVHQHLRGMCRQAGKQSSVTVEYALWKQSMHTDLAAPDS
jgi:hypothetical protein